MVSREIWIKQALVRYSRTSKTGSILAHFEKTHLHASFFIQNALETTLYYLYKNLIL